MTQNGGYLKYSEHISGVRVTCRVRRNSGRSEWVSTGVNKRRKSTSVSDRGKITELKDSEEI